MRKIWVAILFTVKVAGRFFDLIEPYAVALDAPVAWTLAVASIILGGISLSGREVSLTLMGGAWFLMAFLLCPALKIGYAYKAIGCGIAVFLLTILEKYATQ